MTERRLTRRTRRRRRVSPWLPMGIGATAGMLLLLVVVLVGAVTDPTDDAAPPTTLGPPPAPTTTASTEPPPTTTTADPGQTTAPPVRPPGQVRVLVLNGAGIEGVAGRITDGLTAAGYQAVEPGNADRRSVSTLFVRSGYELECAAVSELLQPRFADPLPTGELREAPDVAGRDDADCVALVGDDIVATD